MRRRINGAVRHERADGLVIARFRHHTSRSCAEQHEKGQAPDPQLHDHCAIANLALRQHDALAKNGGNWAAVDSRELYRIAAEAGAVYRAELAAELLQLGYRVHREGRYFEVSGVSKEARHTFSQRAREVEAATTRFVAKHGRRPTDEEARNLVVLSRHPKAAEQVSAFAQWHERAAEVGFSPTDLEQLRGRTPGALSLEMATDQIVRELVAPDSPHALTKNAAVFDERTLRIAVAEAAQGRARGADVGALITAVAASPELVRLDVVHSTTQKMLDTERAALLAARVKSLSAHGFSAKRSSVSAAISTARVALSDEQQTAVRALTDDRALALITAPAGAGKGEVLRAVTQAYRQDGRRVIALAAAGDTAQRLGAEIGVDEARTLDSFIVRAGGNDPPDIRGAVLVVDEAGLLETERWHRLLPATVGAKLIAAGDSAQLSPIEAGGLWPVLEQRLGAPTLSENFRAREQWARDAWTALREGQSVDALRAFEEREQIVVVDDRQAARAAAVDRWDRERMGRGEGGWTASCCSPTAATPRSMPSTPPPSSDV
ncbi:MAG: AAA family ATPase [Candidatus Dormibacteraeota bacterium]|uniref:AAA family ATPase n=1 Tax=Candidatus Amunia macphersoniae TaxID=3127014 RepID=A0A934KCN1_9BACT|nr:AAA family ATPase [Candidatus Dormibacteraeota bacterium]